MDTSQSLDGIACRIKVSTCKTVVFQRGWIIHIQQDSFPHHDRFLCKVGEYALIWTRVIVQTRCYRQMNGWMDRWTDGQRDSCSWWQYSETCLEGQPYCQEKVVIPDRWSFQRGSVYKESNSRQKCSEITLDPDTTHIWPIWPQLPWKLGYMPQNCSRSSEITTV